MAATLDDIYKVLQDIKDCTPCPTGAAGAAGAGGAAGAAGGLAQELGGIEATTGSVNQLEDAVKQAQKAVGNAKKGTKEYDKSLKELRKAQAELNKEVDKGTKGMGGFGKALNKTGSAMGNLAKKGFSALAGAALNYIKKTMSLVSSLRATEQAMRATTGASAALADGIGRAYDKLRIYGVSIGEASAATNSLMSTATDFTMMSQKQQDMLTQQAAILNEVGVSTTDYATGIQVATKNMGMSSEEGAHWMVKLRATAIDLQMPISELTGKVGGMASELDLLGDKALPVFGEMARLQKAAGVEMDKLLNMTNKFDTFKGAAEAAGGLNAALGGNFVNAMELHMAEDMPTRIMMLRDAMDAAGKDWTTMGRQEKLFYSKVLDSDVATVGKIMTSDLHALEEQMGKTEASIGEAEFDAFSMKSFEEIGENMLKATMPSINAIENALTATFDANARQMLAVTKQINATMLAGTDKIISGMDPQLLQLLTSLALLLNMFPQLGSIASSIFGGISAGAVATGAAFVGLVAMATGAIMGVYDSQERVIAAGGDAWDKMGAAALGAGKGIADGLDFVLGGFGKHLGWWEEGLIEKMSRGASSSGMSFKEAWEEIDFGFISETFGYMFGEIWSDIKSFFSDITASLGKFWEDLSWKSIKSTFAGWIDGFKDTWQDIVRFGEVFVDDFKAIFGIGHSSLLFEGFGNDMVGSLMQPFSGLDKKMSSEVEKAATGVKQTAAATGVSPEIGRRASAMQEAMGISRHEALYRAGGNEIPTSSDKPYVLNLSMNLDGREVDKKVVKVIGGVARDAAWGA